MDARDIIKRPVITERSSEIMSDKKYTFEVDVRANKTQVKDAVQEIFGVKVEKVNIMNYKGKFKRMGKHAGYTKRADEAILGAIEIADGLDGVVIKGFTTAGKVNALGNVTNLEYAYNNITSTAFNNFIVTGNGTNVNFYQSDVFSNVSEKYDVIISNPPYIAYDEEIMDIVYNNEPHTALFADDNGLYFYDKIL